MDNTDTGLLRDKARMGLFAKIEDEVDVLSLIVNGLHVWPVLRLALSQRTYDWRGPASATATLEQHFEALELATPHVPGWGGNIADDPFACVNYREMFARNDQEGHGLGALFLCRPNEANLRFDGCAFNSLIDPHIHLIENTHSYLKIEPGNDNPRPNLRDFHPVARVPIDFPPRERARTVEKEIGSFRVNCADALAKIAAIVSENLPGLEYRSYEDVEQPLIETLNYMAYFERYLNAIRPRVVFMGPYWYPKAMGLIAAAKPLGIPVVELQHGGTADFNHPYTHWRRFPREGYRFLPDLFWCWGQREVDMYRRWHPPGCRTPIPFHGGNPALIPAAYDQLLADDEPSMLLRAAMRPAGKVIMAALATEEDGDIPDILLHAMHISPPDWLWLVRGHPHFFHDKWPLVEQKVATVIPGRYDLLVTSKQPLARVLQYTDHLVGGLSGVAVDALAFGVQTTFVGSLIEHHTPDICGYPAYYRAGTPQELIQSIIDHPKLPPETFRWFIDNSRERARRVMETLLGAGAA
jgi:hypothetical protein